MATPRALVIRAPGTNCDEETVAAWTQAGALAETAHVNQLLSTPSFLDRFQILTFPGGFSYGDDLGAGRILAARVTTALGEELRRFHERGGLIAGICNGFQVLVRAGLLPGDPHRGSTTLAHNDSARFEARWIRLLPLPGRSPFVSFSEPIELPVAHGEGKFLVNDSGRLADLERHHQIVLRYGDDQNRPTQRYPANPNGSLLAVAGVCDPSGRIFGLMPHPERYTRREHHPRWTRREANRAPDGLRVFSGAVDYWR